MKGFSRIFMLCALAFSLAACDNGLGELNGNGHGNGGGSNTAVSTEPAPCTNKIVAHRGGSSECGMPDNSKASLRYAMSLGLYGSECDIYWTNDNRIVIAHADGNSQINHLYPWEHSLEELRKAGRLANGEELPSLEDFLDIVIVKDNCTRLVLDIKLISSHTEYSSKAVTRACEIIKERGARKFVEFICTGNETVAIAAAQCMQVYNIPVGWMANKSPKEHMAKGFTWANLSAATYMTPYGKGVRTVDEFINAGMEISVFNVDKKSGDGNAVYSEDAVKYYLSRYKDLRCICTNYPKWLLENVNSL